LTESEQTLRWRAVAVLTAGACVLGLSPVLVRLTETGPAAAGFWRLTLALPALALLAQRVGALKQPPSRFALAAGLMFALDLTFWHYGIKYTSVANSTVLANLTPVVVTAFAWAFLKERPRPLFLLAVAVAVGGAVLMGLQRNGAPGLNPPLGDLLSTVTTLWYAGYILAVSAARRRESASGVMFWSSLVAAPLLLAAATLLHEEILPATSAGWGACVGLAFVHVAGQGAIAWAMGRLPAATASVTILVQPVVAAALGLALFGEVLTPLQALGGLTALAGVVLAQQASRTKT
jgi:drug/metabolite transporter (DMT)-like permease